MKLSATTYLRLDQHQIDEQHNHVMLDVFVGKAFASWALRQSHTLAQRFVIGFAVCRVESLDVLSASEKS